MSEALALEPAGVCACAPVELVWLAVKFACKECNLSVSTKRIADAGERMIDRQSKPPGRERAERKRHVEVIICWKIMKEHAAHLWPETNLWGWRGRGRAGSRVCGRISSRLCLGATGALRLRVCRRIRHLAVGSGIPLQERGASQCSGKASRCTGKQTFDRRWHRKQWLRYKASI